MGCVISSRNSILDDYESDSNEKLRVLVLHGTLMCGRAMKNMSELIGFGKEINVGKNIEFYYPDGPCEVTLNHPFYKQMPWMLPPGPNKRHWWTMTDKWDFRGENFEDARKCLFKFLDEKVKKPIHVLMGYSQGSMACTQIINDVLKGKLKSKYLNNLKGIVFMATPIHPQPNELTRKWDGLTLHLNGTFDSLTQLANAQQHANLFKNNTFFHYVGDHSLSPACNSTIREFMQTLRGKLKTNETANAK
eukprot:Mrub_04868.p1 GENE.Mrub_04868~~Mrub_04868.p1  ORF type:complete len:248 (+),score=21.64 Mrub_04868:47-790(+)